MSFPLTRDISGSSSTASTRPLPLKQRTSSVDARRDFTSHTVLSLLRLLKPREYLITVDNFSIWRRHLAWAMEGEGSDLRGYICQRYASSMVFMSLLLGAALNVLFNSDKLVTEIRQDMRSDNYMSISFWAGFTMLLSVILTILSIISTFTAWGMVNAVSDANSHCILRSSIGQYVAELPGRFIVASIYCFLIWVILLCIIMLPSGFWSYIMVIITFALFMHVVVVFSAFGRIIMHSGAMGPQRIFEPEFERGLLPHGLHSNLLAKATQQLESKTSILRQYRYPSKPLDGVLGSDSVSNGSTATPAAPTQQTTSPPQYNSNNIRPTHHHRRSSSSVRFADNLLSSSTPVVVDSPLSRDYTPSVNRKGLVAPRPPRPPNLVVPTSSAESKDLSASPEGAIDAWIDGSHAFAAKPRDAAEQGKPIPDTIHNDNAPNINAATGGSAFQSILHPSSYTTLQPRHNVEINSIDGGGGQSLNNISENVTTEITSDPSQPGSRSRKYFNAKTTPRRPPEPNVPVESYENFDKDDDPDMDASSQQLAPKRKYWSGAATPKKTQNRLSPTGGPDGISDTQRAAMAATDAVTRLMSRPGLSDRKTRNVHGPTTTRHVYQEYGGNISNPSADQVDLQQQLRSATTTSQTTDAGGGESSSESHPLLWSDANHYYNAVSARQNHKNDDDENNAVDPG